MMHYLSFPLPISFAPPLGMSLLFFPFQLAYFPLIQIHHFSSVTSLSCAVKNLDGGQKVAFYNYDFFYFSCAKFWVPFTLKKNQTKNKKKKNL